MHRSPGGEALTRFPKTPQPAEKRACPCLYVHKNTATLISHLRDRSWKPFKANCKKQKHANDAFLQRKTSQLHFLSIIVRIIICLQICKEKKIQIKFVVLVNGKKCTMVIYLQRFNKILVTLYIVHMGLKFLFYLFCIQIFISVFAGSLCFFIYRRVSFFPFIDFYLWRVI